MRPTASPSASCWPAHRSPACRSTPLPAPLLAQMQAVKPQPRLTFTYDVPAERPRPDYRMVLVFDAANDFGSTAVCAGAKPRLKAGTPGRLNVLPSTAATTSPCPRPTAWTDATGPDDPRVGELFRELFTVLFSDALGLRPQSGAAICAKT